MDALAGDSIIGQEALASWYHDREMWPRALAALERAQALNVARPAEETPEQLGGRGWLARERLRLAVRLAERRMAVLRLAGDPDALEAGLNVLRQARAAWAAPGLARVDALISAEATICWRKRCSKRCPKMARRWSLGRTPASPGTL